VFLCCAYYTGVISGVKIEADSNDVTKHPHDDKTRPYLCMVCDKRFDTKQHLKCHQETHTVDKLHLCSQCDKSFATERYLMSHMNVHNAKHKCTECGKCCQTNRDLTVHRRSHSGEKPFECSVCSKRFTRHRTLVKHSGIHCGEKTQISSAFCIDM